MSDELFDVDRSPRTPEELRCPDCGQRLVELTKGGFLQCPDERHGRLHGPLTDEEREGLFRADAPRATVADKRRRLFVVSGRKGRFRRIATLTPRSAIARQREGLIATSPGTKRPYAFYERVEP